MNSSQADWATITNEELEQQSELIVVGELIEEKLMIHPAYESEIKVGVIRYSEIFKGKVLSETILIKLPLLGPGLVLSSSDITFSVGQKGLWYLQKMEDELFFVERPDSFVPQEFAVERISDLRCKSD